MEFQNLSKVFQELKKNPRRVIVLILICFTIYLGKVVINNIVANFFRPSEQPELVDENDKIEPNIIEVIPSPQEQEQEQEQDIREINETGQNSNENFLVDGQIVDSLTENPIEGAVVSIGSVSTKTDRNGYFRITHHFEYEKCILLYHYDEKSRSRYVNRTERDILIRL